MMLTMRTTINVDPAILAAARSVAARTGRSLGDVISEWARRGLQTPRARAASRSFPTFRVPPDAAPITSETVRELVDDEGLPPRR